MALTNQDKKDIEKIAQKEIKDFLNTTNAHQQVVRIIQKEMGTRDINEKVVDLATKVVVELFKNLWQRKSFWESGLKNVR